MNGIQFGIFVAALFGLAWERNRQHDQSIKAVYKGIGYLNDIKNLLILERGRALRL
jgi:hypothetical protein